MLALDVPDGLMNPAPAVDSLEAGGLAAHLYLNWYAASPSTVDFDPNWPPLDGMLRVAQAESLGWRAATVARTGGGGVVVARGSDGRGRALLRGGYTRPEASSRCGLAPEAGERIVAVPRSGGIVSEGWWRSWGGGWDPRSAPPGTTRLYLSPDVWALPQLMGALTVLLEERSEPWMIKAATRAESVGRPDAVVLYLADAAAFDAVVELCSGRVHPKPGPALTEQLAPGIAWAEDPGDGRSFGESRCLLVADALRRGGRSGFLDAVEAEFAAAGIDPARPHLRARS